jgi:exopolyphosphatase/guanosine-5'-triphosphate,3'-diphosphate pyrophosphatase
LGDVALPQHATDSPIAVIDVGSNSGRVLVARRGPDGGLQVLEEQQRSLRLMRALGDQEQLSDEAMDRTVRALQDFTAIAARAGAERVHAVATAAVREARNRAEFAERIREETGIELEIIDGSREAELAFIGAISNLPVEHGLLMDIGGGSVQVVRARDRGSVRSWTFPLGALRLSDRFLRSDPPTTTEVEELRSHVNDVISREQLPRLSADEHLVATGGSARNLARMDRETHHYPIARVHGYTLKARRLAAIVEMVRTRKTAKRRKISGLSGDRADSIVGGALVAQALMDYVGASEIQISAQGLREGLAHAILATALPPVATLRATSVAALAQRFATWDQPTADRRAAVATALLHAVLPEPPREVCETISFSAQLIDIGRSVDYYRRHRHAETVVRAADLAGFSHREVALLVATLGQVADGKPHPRRYAPLIGREDRATIALCAAVVAAAEEIERRCAAGVPLQVLASHERDVIELQVAGFLGGDLGSVSKRLRKAGRHWMRVIPLLPGEPVAMRDDHE